jgi:hypothetical protein
MNDHRCYVLLSLLNLKLFIPVIYRFYLKVVDDMYDQLFYENIILSLSKIYKMLRLLAK